MSVAPEIQNSDKTTKDTHPVLVPGPNGALRVGADDEHIQRSSLDNLLRLEDEPSYITYTYAVLMDVDFTPLTLSKPRRTVVKREWKVHNIIHATTMLEAIRIFEDKNGKRLWLPEGEATEQQLGIPRIIANGSVRKVRIQKIRKDCIFNN